MTNPDAGMAFQSPSAELRPAPATARSPRGKIWTVLTPIFRGPLGVFVRYRRARQFPIRVLARMAWLLANRSINRRFPFTLHAGARLMARYDFGSPILGFYLGLYEHASMNFLVRYLKPGDVFADVGANVGVYSVLASGVSGAFVHAFEPVTSARRALLDNLALNNLQKAVVVRKQGVGAAPGKALITTNRHGSNTIVQSDANDIFEEIEIVTLDDVMAIAPPDVIKIDVEGFEEEVVQGALNTLSKQRVNVVIVEAISRRLVDGNRVTRITNLLESFGFDTYTFDPDTSALVQCSGPNRFVGPDDENYLFVKDARKAAQRIAESVV